MIYLGIDPGMSGGIGIINDFKDGSPIIIDTVIFKNMTEKDISYAFWALSQKIGSGMDLFAYIEKVHGFPGMSVKAVSSFMTNFGLLKGCLHSFNIPFEEIPPQRWQKALSCLTHGDKNISKNKAQQLFPNIKITHGNADALLLAEYCRRMRT